MRALVVTASACALAVLLQGCSESKTDTPTPAPTPGPSPGPSPGPPTPPPAPRPPKGWKLNPIEVKGQHMFDAVTGDEFFARGIGMPNLKDDIDEWIAVLHRVRKQSPHVNLVRVYELPACATNTTLRCMDPFMRAADDLGFYMLVPGTGTVWGYLPRQCKSMEEERGRKLGAATCCSTADECYKLGGVLGWGQTILQMFNFPNTLAVVVGNEFDQQTPQFMPTIKGYTRDLKQYMKMCNTDDKSPSKGQMRQIPLLYASSDDRGDSGAKPKADYLFCAEKEVSVDIFGLNIERFCDDKHGPIQYNGVQKWVSEGQYDGAFIFSEMGCTKQAYQPDQARNWKQVEGFFETWSAFDGFVAYTYFGNKNFDMFDGPTADATMFKDGKNFFDAVEHVGKLDSRQNVDPKKHDCATSILSKKIDDYSKVKWYNTGATGWPAQCPPPTKPKQSDVEIIL